MSLIGTEIKTEQLQGLLEWGAIVRGKWSASALTEADAIKDLLNKIQLSKDPSKQALANLHIQNSAKLYDPKCYELASHMLQGESFDTDEARHDLAAELQVVCESFISDLESK